MVRQYWCLVPALTFCTMFAIAGTARSARTITPDAPPTAAETAAARRALASDFKDAEQTSHHPLTFTVGHADLNGDGRPDLIIHYTDQGWCGSHGCWAYALLAGPGGYSAHAIMLAIFLDTVTVLDTTHHGMHDLRYDDSTYVFCWTGTEYDGCAEQPAAKPAALAFAGIARSDKTITPDAPPTAAETAAARRALASNFRETEGTLHHTPTFTVGHADLNGDGRLDLIIHFTDRDWCGMENCSAYALLAVPGGYSTHAIDLALFPPGDSVTILGTTHHGMHDLRFDDSTYVFCWTGTAYDGCAEHPAAHPAARPAARPAKHPAERPAAQAAAQPAERPVAKHAARPAAKPAAQPAEPSQAEMDQLQERMTQLSARARAVDESLNQIRSQQAAQGLGLRNDMATADSLMRSYLDAANRDMQSSRADAAGNDMNKAEAQLDTLEKFLGK